jgi:SAM-dependent methyltransferase
MDERELQDWFAAVQHELESAYLTAAEPWKQSGFSGPAERWVACRRPIAECMTEDGAFLDIGCANGYLLECVRQWTAVRGVSIAPWGLDLSERLVALAKARLDDGADQLFVGNGLFWQPPRKFDYVRTELCYVPEGCRRRYVRRLLSDLVCPGGKLLLAEYRSRQAPSADPWVDDVLRDLGFAVAACVSGLWESKELTRVAVVRKGD